MKNPIYSFAFLLFFSSPCFADAKLFIERAEQKLAEVAKLEYQWTTTAPLIEKAKHALAKGDEATAEALAKEAIAQTEYGLKQAEYANQNWQEGEPK